MHTIFFILCIIIFAGCQSAGRGMVSDLGDRASEYRTVQGEIRSGQAELVGTGTAIEGASREVTTESRDLASGLSELEQAIERGTGTDIDLDAVIRAVRNRPVSIDFIEKWKYNRTGAKTTDSQKDRGTAE